MTGSVLSRVLEQCRKALLGATPIIYIKTDSDVFIQKLVTCETDPLVVLLSSGGRKGTDSDLKQMRPIYELKNIQDRQPQFCQNYRNAVPQMASGGIYRELYAPAPRDYSNEKIIGPFLWVYKMPTDETMQGQQDFRNSCDALENYVANHENPGHPQYPVLQSSVVILYSSQVKLSPALQTYTEIVDVDFPDEEEIRQIIKEESAGNLSLIENEEYLSALCTDFLGFSAEEIIATMQRIMAVSSLENSGEVEGIINEHKRQKLQGGLLEQCLPSGDIGGMRSFRDWLESQIEPLKNANSYMRKIGTPPPKGVLLCGIPGCGKSEAAKFTAQTLKLPLLRMDIGSLMDKYQGVSEQKMRDALKMAEAMSPCVLWIDELEKGFSGAGSNGDSSSFKRMFGYMLGWMQDNQKPCFIFATANDIGGLPKEFFRSGRFDALYAVYLPTAEECANIFKACMGKAEKNIAKARHAERKDISIFAEGCASDGLLRRVVNEALVRPDGGPRIVVGSDIQKIVNLALRALTGEERVTEKKWEEALKNVISDPSFSAYGDGGENVDSIAIGYCRMLRKGFIPASDTVLFSKEDYHMENAGQYERLMRMPTASMTEDERREHEQKLREHAILQDKKPCFADRYDEAVYACLIKRINEIALPLEKHEREQMIVR